MNHIIGLNKILNLKQKKQFFVLVVLMLISMILEVSLLKFVFELLNSLSNNAESSNSFITKFFLNLKIKDNAILVIIFVIFLVYLIKTSINLLINWISTSQ